MTTVTTAAVVYEPGGQFTLETVELDEPRGDEILIRVDACGVCHTDLIAQGELTPLPAVLGHEGTGVVEAVGNAVHRVKPGDRVVVSYPWCGACPKCAEGRPYICNDAIALSFDGTRADGSVPISLDGTPISSAFFQQSTFARHALTLERDVVRIDNDMPAELLAALPCGIQTGAGSIINTFRASARDNLVVFGAGAVGLSAVMMARVLGLSPIIAVDIHRVRLDLALELGATHALDAREGEVPRRVLEIVPGGMHFALETSSNEQALEDAVACLGMEGVCGMVTAPRFGEKYPFSPSDVMIKAASLRGIIQGSSVPGTFLPRLIELQQQGQFPVERLVRTYDFADINQAFADSHDGTAVKPVLKMT